MLAAADYAEQEGNPPPELALAFACQNWKCLPHEGGYLDQPAGMMRKLTAAVNVYNAFTGFKNAENGAEWAKNNPQYPELIKQVERIRETNG